MFKPSAGKVANEVLTAWFVDVIQPLLPFVRENKKAPRFWLEEEVRVEALQEWTMPNSPKGKGFFAKSNPALKKVQEQREEESKKLEEEVAQAGADAEAISALRRGVRPCLPTVCATACRKWQSYA